MIRRTRLFPELFTPDNALHIAGSGIHRAFDKEIRLLVWNIYKGRNRTWQDDFLHVVKDRNLVLLQESVMNTRHDVLFESPEQFEWIMAKTYMNRRTQASTGVKTGSSVISSGRSFYISPDVEPIVRTPKMLLATAYPIADEKTLLTVNIHAVNFVSLLKYNRQIAQIIEAVENHEGPVILAGDFNTWNAERYKNLRIAADRMGLQEVSLQKRGRWHYLNQNLDYVFYRGLTLQKADVLLNIRTSDHYPIIVDFTLA